MNISEASRNLGAPYSTVPSYLRCLGAAGLLYLLPKFAASVEAEARSLERVYAIDLGLYLSLARVRSADLDRTGGWGRLAEIGVLEVGRRVVPWVFAIARNLALTTARSATRRSKRLLRAY